MVAEWMLLSPAVLVTTICVSSLTTWVAIRLRLGARLTSRTSTVKLLVAFNCGFSASYGLLLVTTVVITLVLGLCVWAGVQVMIPLVLIAIPSGGLTSP